MDSMKSKVTVDPEWAMAWARSALAYEQAAKVWAAEDPDSARAALEQAAVAWTWAAVAWAKGDRRETWRASACDAAMRRAQEATTLAEGLTCE